MHTLPSKVTAQNQKTNSFSDKRTIIRIHHYQTSPPENTYKTETKGKLRLEVVKFLTNIKHESASSLLICCHHRAKLSSELPLLYFPVLGFH